MVVASAVMASIPARAGDSGGRLATPATAPAAMNITCARTCAVFPATTLDALCILGTPRLCSSCTFTASPPM